MGIHARLVGGPHDGAAGPVDVGWAPTFVTIRPDPSKRASNGLLFVLGNSTGQEGELYVLMEDEGEEALYQHQALQLYVPSEWMAAGA